MDYRAPHNTYPYGPLLTAPIPGAYPIAETYPPQPYPAQNRRGYPPPVMITAPLSSSPDNNNNLTPWSPAPPRSPARPPRTFLQWKTQAKEATADMKRNGFPSPVSWWLVEGNNIPPNAVIAGDDHGKPLYIARTFYETGIQIGKAGRHLRLGASIPFSGREVDVSTYEVLVEALTPARWTFQEPAPPAAVERPMLFSAMEQPASAVSSGATGLQRLSEVKPVIIVDDSISMAGQAWNDAREAVAGLAELYAQYDTDGLDVYFLNDPRCRVNLRDRGSLYSLFELVLPEGQTPIGSKLKEVVEIYIPKLEDRRVSHKPVKIVIATDGVPNDNPVETITDAARRLDMSGVPLRQLGIHLVQVGDDVEATNALKDLDDECAGLFGVRDMVDVTVFNPDDPGLGTDSLVRILLNGVDQAPDVPVAPPFPKAERPGQRSYY